MPTVQLRYVGALTHADVPILRREGEPLDEHGDGCLVQGETFICDAKIAGRAPTYDDDGNVTDYGDGLLAQPGNFELAEKPAKKAVAKKPDPPADSDSDTDAQTEV